MCNHTFPFSRSGSRQELLEFVSSCQDQESGGISPSPQHDPHLLYTLSAVQILAMLDALSEEKPVIDVNKVVRYIKSLQQADGSFFGDKWGEVDLRFSFLSIACLSLLNKLEEIDTNKAADYIMKCHNVIDSGFGSRPGSESHAGLVYCAVGSLSILGQLHRIDSESLAWWLCERQLPESGGLNGRPEKLPDLCYSWWILSSLTVLNRVQWIDRKKLIKFILTSQDSQTGGFADRPGNMPDPFHTCFGLTGLSLLTHEMPDCDDGVTKLSSQLQEVNPVFCMPQQVIEKMGIKVQMM